MEFENIVEIENGLKYAYDKEGQFDTEYIAECNEYGEDFCTSFYAPSNYTNDQLLEIGKDLARIWGGICTEVYKAEK
jgi:hypothetical protein